jgi:hypothetical protein
MKKIAALILANILAYGASYPISEVEITFNNDSKLYLRPLEVRQDPSGTIIPTSDKGLSDLKKNPDGGIVIAGYELNRAQPLNKQAEIIQKWPFVKSAEIKSTDGDLMESAREAELAMFHANVESINHKIQAMNTFIGMFMDKKDQLPHLKAVVDDYCVRFSDLLVEKFPYLTMGEKIEHLKVAIGCVEKATASTPRKEYSYHLANLQYHLGLFLLDENFKDQLDQIKPLDPTNENVKVIKLCLEAANEAGIPKSEDHLKFVLDRIKAFESKNKLSENKNNDNDDQSTDTQPSDSQNADASSDVTDLNTPTTN